MPQITMPIGDSEPEPDVQVTAVEIPTTYARHPGPQDMALVVEVSESSLARRSRIQETSLRHQGVPVYWIVNLVDRRLEVYSEPSGPADAPDYRRRQIFGPGQRVPLILDGREVGCDRGAFLDLLP